MKIWISLIMIWCTAALGGPDAGVGDAGDDLASAGIYQVASAEPVCPDGGVCTTLGPGWWLSDDRVQRTGTKLVELGNENADLRSGQVSWMKAALIGFGVGAVFGVGTMVWLLSKR